MTVKPLQKPRNVDCCQSRGKLPSYRRYSDLLVTARVALPCPVLSHGRMTSTIGLWIIRTPTGRDLLGIFGSHSSKEGDGGTVLQLGKGHRDPGKEYESQRAIRTVEKDVWIVWIKELEGHRKYETSVAEIPRNELCDCPSNYEWEQFQSKQLSANIASNNTEGLTASQCTTCSVGVYTTVNCTCSLSYCNIAISVYHYAGPGTIQKD
ncbi:hypothetical protein J6590_036433 [Homalodisca vitripennis]|nr:hypothetical protein J6590_036433 [Homalodisca vitripennis]